MVISGSSTPTLAVTGTTTVSGSNTGDQTAGTGLTLTGSAFSVNASQTQITALGTIATGVWNGTKVAALYGGTGIDSSASTGVAQVSSGTWSVSTALPSATTATTQSAGDNTTSVATDAFVTTAIANAIAGVDPAVSVLAATTAASNTSGFTYSNGVSGVGATFTQNSAAAVTIDGVSFNTIGQRLLVKNDTQTSPGSVSAGTFNGVYTVTTVGTGLIPAVFTRALDYDTPSDINSTGAIPVLSGTVNALSSWLLNTTIAAVGTGTNVISYTQFSFNPSNIVPPTLGGTGIANNSASTLTISGSFATTLTVTNTTSVTLPTSGTLVSSVTTGNGVSATNTAGALAFTLGAITPTTVKGLTITTSTGTLTIANGKTATVNNSLTFAGTDSTTMTFPGSSDTVVTLAATQTLTNKRITKRVVTAADATSVTPNSDNADITYQSNSQALGTLTINADGGTPTNGQSWLFKIKSTNVQTFAWNAVFVGGAVALPTASSGGGKIDYYSFMYDTVNSHWDFTGQALTF